MAIEEKTESSGYQTGDQLRLVESALAPSVSMKRDGNERLDA
jgi:hypothetical protein